MAKRFTRESFNKKRILRKLQLIFVYFLFAFLIVSLCVLLYVKVTDKSKGKKAGAVKYNVEADLGKNPVGYIDYNLMITHNVEQFLSAHNNTGDTDNSGEIDGSFYEYMDIDFKVPETSLGPVEDVKPNNWYDENLYQKVQGPVNFGYFNYACFIGDSRTEGLVIYSGLPNINGLYYKGLSVDKLESDYVITIPGVGSGYTCYEAVSKTDYQAYYLMFGVNELGWVYTDIFVEDMSKFIDYIKSIRPNAVIYVQSILPVSLSSSQKSQTYNQDRVNMFNEELLKMCQERGDVIYLDSASAVMDENGYLPEDASTDGVHCSADYVKRLIQFYRYNVYIKK